MGITWLPIPFGLYFAFRLASLGRGPSHRWLPLALAARLPVAIVMFLAMRGQWGTHYDYVGMPPQFQMSPLPRFLWLAFFPQLVFWVAFTVLLGCLAGSLISLGARRRRPA